MCNRNDRSLASPHADSRALIAGALSSVCLALSFTANYSFAFVDAAAWVLLAGWALRHAIAGGRPLRRLATLAAAYFLPGCATVLLLDARTLVQWPAGQLYYGATSLWETLQSVAEASLYRPNPSWLSPQICSLALWVQPFLIPAVLTMTASQCFSVMLSRKPGPFRSRLALAAIFLGAAVLGLFAHWCAFRIFSLLLPRDRTAIYLAPLVILTAGVLASIEVPTFLGRIFPRALLATLALTAVYFCLCLRFTYFKEWWWDADVEHAYDIVAYYNHRFGVTEVPVSWHYEAALNFYRLKSGKETLAEFHGAPDPQSYPKEKQVYVLFYPFDQALIRDRKLKVVFHDEFTDLVVAIDRKLEKSMF